MENIDKPLTPKDLEDAAAPAKSPSEIAERIAEKLLSAKSELLTDETFLANITYQALKGPSTFPREDAKQAGGVQVKIKKHSLKGRTNKIKVMLWLSDSEVEQLTAYRDERGDRTVADLVNEVVCRALAALRAL